jgi:phosphoglycolate phosphatase
MFTGNLFEQIDNNPDTYRKKDRSKEEEQGIKQSYTQEKGTTVALYDGIHELIQSLHSCNIPMAINTSASEENTYPVLKRHGITSYFEPILTRDQVKSKATKFDMIKEQYRVDDEQLVFITDSLGDLYEAQEKQIPSIAVTWGVHDYDILNRYDDTNLLTVVDSVEELSGYLHSYIKK